MTGGRDAYPFWAKVRTRWSDNDMFGHLNNVQYYRFFEVAVTEFLCGPCGLDILNSAAIPFSAETGCRFRRPLSWPSSIDAGLVVRHVGNTSVRYGIGLFSEGVEAAAAEGSWVHVFVDRSSQRPVPIPARVREAFGRFLCPFTEPA